MAKEKNGDAGDINIDGEAFDGEFDDLNSPAIGDDDDAIEFRESPKVGAPGDDEDDPLILVDEDDERLSDQEDDDGADPAPKRADDDDTIDPFAEADDEEEDLRAELERERQLRQAAEARAKQQQAPDVDYDDEIAKIDEELKDAREKLKAAKDDGDTDAEIEIGEQHSELLLRKRQLNWQKENPPPPPDNPALNKWLGRHQWYQRKGAKEDQLRPLVNSIDAQVAADGFNPNTDAYFEELDKRLKTQLPNYFGRKRKAGKQNGSTGQRQRTTRTNTTGNKPRGGAKRLTRQQAANMERFGLDPKDKTQVAEYLRNAG